MLEKTQRKNGGTVQRHVSPRCSPLPSDDSSRVPDLPSLGHEKTKGTGTVHKRKFEKCTRTSSQRQSPCQHSALEKITEEVAVFAISPAASCAKARWGAWKKQRDLKRTRKKSAHQYASQENAEICKAREPMRVAAEESAR